MSNIFTIYRAINKITGKCYIGFTSRWPNRKWSHNKSAKRENNYFHNAIVKYGKDAFVWDVIFQAIGGIETKEWMLNTMEPHFIKEYNSYCHWENGGYNSTFGGEAGPSLSGETNPFFGKKHTQSFKDKQRLNRLGKKDSTETIKNKKKAASNRTQEQREKWRTAKLGTKESEETKLKKKIAATKAWEAKRNGTFIPLPR